MSAATIIYWQIFTILTTVILLLDYEDATPPMKTHTYSHTANVTVIEVSYLQIYPLLLINSFPSPNH